MNPVSSIDSSTRLVEITPTPVIQSQWLDDIRPALEDQWVLFGVIPRQGVILVYGPSGSGKTFFVIELAPCIAAERDWAGRRVKGGLVVYIATEAAGSVANRAFAWRDRRGHPGIPFLLMSHALNLLDSDGASQVIDYLHEVVRERGPLRLIVIDTLARALPGGDENSAAVMGSAVAEAERLRERFDCAVMFIHHSGKSAENGARGSSALRAAVDCEIAIEATENGHRATVTKSRDGETGQRFTFKLVQYSLGESPDGDPVTTCLVDELEFVERAAISKRERCTSAQRIALEALSDVLSSKGRPAEDGEVPSNQIGQIVVRLDEWRAECYAQGISRGQDAAKRQAFNRVLNELQAREIIKTRHDLVWSCDRRDKA